MDTIDPKAKDLICHFEGLRLRAYRDAAGIWTIGYGTTIGWDGKAIPPDTTITKEEAAKFLERDLVRFSCGVVRLVSVPLHPLQHGALVSFCYNLGLTAFRSSTLRRHINNHQWDDVPYQFSRWVYAGGRRLRGLVLRRADEAHLWMSGNLQKQRRTYADIARKRLENETCSPG